jgi:hypothetical protein
MMKYIFDYFDGEEYDDHETAHILDIATFDGLLEVVSLLIVVDMQEVVNPIHHLEPRLRFLRLESRKQAGSLRIWLSRRCNLSHIGKRVDFKTFYNDYFHNQLDALASGLMQSVQGGKPADRQAQARILSDIERLHGYKPTSSKSFAWKGPSYNVELQEAQVLCKLSVEHSYTALLICCSYNLVHPRDR